MNCHIEMDMISIVCKTFHNCNMREPLNRKKQQTISVTCQINVYMPRFQNFKCFSIAFSSRYEKGNNYKYSLVCFLAWIYSPKKCHCGIKIIYYFYRVPQIVITAASNCYCLCMLNGCKQFHSLDLDLIRQQKSHDGILINTKQLCDFCK